jgi:SulP family sulfate permease
MSRNRSIFPIATALRKTMLSYNLNKFQGDLSAGLIVSLMALPLAMALAIAVNLPPQHGIYTAIVAGITIALLGGSTTQVSGPTAAFIVIVAPIVAKFGLHGIIWCQIFAGILLIAMGTARLGRYINYVPYPVTTGFTAGIAVVIATLALNDFLGLNIKNLEGDYIEKVSTIIKNLTAFNPFEFGIGLISLLTILFFHRLTRIVPSAIAGIVIGSILAYLLEMYGINIAIINDRFSYMDNNGAMLKGIPPYLPQFHWPSDEVHSLLKIPDYHEFKALLAPSMVIAILAALESLLSATVADSITRTKHNPNAELNAVGIGNIMSGLVAGIPATGAIARTTANIYGGAKTPLAAVFHSLLIMAFVLLLTPLLNLIPMSSLAALLLYTAYRMSHVDQFIRILKIAHSNDIIILLSCFTLTVLTDMVIGVTVGIVLASLLFMKHISKLTKMHLSPLSESSIELNVTPDFDHTRTMIFKIEGPLFFGTVEKFQLKYNFIHDHINKLVIDMEDVPLIDMSGMVAMKYMLINIAKEDREIIICGKKEITDQILKKIKGTAAESIKTVASIAEIIDN